MAFPLDSVICMCGLLYRRGADTFKDISFSPMIIGIILGMLYANPFAQPSSPDLGAGYSVLFQESAASGYRSSRGFRLTFQDIVNVGVAGIEVDVIIVVVTILGGIWIGRLLKMDRHRASYPVGSGICGAAAVLWRRVYDSPQAYKTAVAVATVVIFGTISMFLYPIAYRSAGLTFTLRRWVSILVPLFMRWLMKSGPAMLMGTGDPLNVSIIVKMIRVMMLVPVLLILGVWAARRNAKDGATAEKGKVNIPVRSRFSGSDRDSTPSICFRIFLSTQSTMLIRSYLQWPWLPWVQRQVLISLRRPVPSRLFLHSASMSGLLSVAISLPNILPRFACRDIIPQ